MYAIYGNIYHQSTPNVSIYTIHGSYGIYHGRHFDRYRCKAHVSLVAWWRGDRCLASIPANTSPLRVSDSSFKCCVSAASDQIVHGSLNVPIEHHPTIRYMVYNGYDKLMSNIPKMGQLPTPELFHFGNKKKGEWGRFSSMKPHLSALADWRIFCSYCFPALETNNATFPRNSWRRLPRNSASAPSINIYCRMCKSHA